MRVQYQWFDADRRLVREEIEERQDEGELRRFYGPRIRMASADRVLVDGRVAKDRFGPRSE